MAFQSYIVDFDRMWWRESLIYEVYVQSFQDTNRDGVGDIAGVTKRLDYLKKLGIDMIWLTPVYKSPMHDQGYDISDYQAINPIFGTMDDWEEMLSQIHERGMKLMMDLVVNHTSSEHEWFLESRSSRNNPKRNWYKWKPPRYDASGKMKPPNNWASFFGGSAWTYDELTGEYYLHLFSTHQPDLNWDYPEVRQAIYDMMTFWLEKGVDGFRMDVINLISKVPDLPDAPIVNPDSELQPARDFFVNGPNVHKYLREMNDRVLSHYDVCTVGEMPCTVGETYQASKYVAKERRELSMVFNFDHMELDALNGEKWVIRKWTLPELKNTVGIWQQHMLGNNGWNSLYFENHDQPRITNRLMGKTRNKELWHKGAMMVATMLLTLRGTVYVYQGQELGMVHPEGWSIEDYRDLETKMYYQHKVEERKARGDSNPDMSDVMEAIRLKGRDNARTPMQWDASPNAGFTDPDVQPWIKLCEAYPVINTEIEMNDPTSIWSYYRLLIRIRRQHPALFYGGYIPLDEENENVYAYLRTQGPFRTLVILNFKQEPITWTIPDELDVHGCVFVVGNYAEDFIVEKEDNGKITVLQKEVHLKPLEARVYTLRT